jgi:hypothetical protein
MAFMDMALAAAEAVCNHPSQKMLTKNFALGVGMDGSAKDRFYL